MWCLWNQQGLPVPDRPTPGKNPTSGEVTPGRLRAILTGFRCIPDHAAASRQSPAARGVHRHHTTGLNECQTATTVAL